MIRAGCWQGCSSHDIRASMGATSTIVTNYLIEKNVAVSPKLATALLYGVESETTGYPREATPLDDIGLIWLFPRPIKTCWPRSATPSFPRATSPRFRPHSPTHLFTTSWS